MIKYKWRTVFVLLFLLVFVQPGLRGEETDDDPIKIKLQNDSDHAVLVHVLAFDMIEDTHSLEPGKVIEIDAAFGNRIRLEYAPSPHETLLSNLGSLNETNRSVFIRNDGKTVFIEEKFSGQRVKGKGDKRIQPRTISDPELEREKKKGGIDRDPASTTSVQGDQQDPVTDKKSMKRKKSTRKEDPSQPEKKKKKEDD
jgi:hypothetical protein